MHVGAGEEHVGTKACQGRAATPFCSVQSRAYLSQQFSSHFNHWITPKYCLQQDWVIPPWKAGGTQHKCSMGAVRNSIQSKMGSDPMQWCAQGLWFPLILNICNKVEVRILLRYCPVHHIENEYLSGDFRIILLIRETAEDADFILNRNFWSVR